MLIKCHIVNDPRLKPWASCPLDREKYLTMEKPGLEKKYFVGTNGGVKYGKNVSSANSIYRTKMKETTLREKLKKMLQ